MAEKRNEQEKNVKESSTEINEKELQKVTGGGFGKKHKRKLCRKDDQKDSD